MKLKLARFAKKEDGSASIEALLWFVVAVTIGGVMTDASAVFHAQSNVMRIMQDANRAYSMGYITNTADHEAYIEGRIDDVSPTVTATTSLNADGDVLTTRVELPASDLMVMGLFASLANITLGFGSKHVIEDWGTL